VWHDTPDYGKETRMNKRNQSAPLGGPYFILFCIFLAALFDTGVIH